MTNADLPTLPERIRQLRVSINGRAAGDLVRQSQMVFKYADDAPDAPAVGLLMPRTALVYTSNSLFPVMDQNLPEGYLYGALRAMYPKQELTAMHLLALMGENGIGRLGYAIDGMPRPAPQALDRATLLHSAHGPRTFQALLRAYLSTGIGIAGMQPKILVPASRATFPVPNLIVKSGAADYPGIAANEFLCLEAARRAGIPVPAAELSDDGQLLLVERFDLLPDGQRLGFEDTAALAGLTVRDTLSDRKYHGSYEAVFQLLQRLGLAQADLARFFEQVCFSAMVRNGDAHLKNFGVLYSSRDDIRLAPMFDVVTTAIYRYQTSPGGPELEDHTMALRLFRRSRTKTYPPPDELERFGTEVCGVSAPRLVFQRMAGALSDTLAAARQDERIAGATLAAMREVWERSVSDLAR